MNNDIVLITGASNGIGRGLARFYTSKGLTVIAVDHDEANGLKLADEINEKGGNCRFFNCDVTKPDQIKELFATIRREIGLVTIVINNAGISKFMNLFDTDVNDWDEIIHTNLRSVFLFSKEAAHLWKDENIRGRIVNMASTRAFMSEQGSEGYAASKGGIISLTHALAVSLAEYQIRVNCISPGWIHTGDRNELREKDHHQHLSGRVGKVTDIAKACWYLTDVENDFVNGENLIIDGGMTRKMIYEH